jgi:tetratricopeptide (TPR) repeat protein
MKHSQITQTILTLTLSLASPYVLCAQSPDSGKPKSDKGPDSSAVESINSDLIAARAATKEKRYADAEAIMLKVTADKPQMIVPWLELGLAQLGLKKYADAESDFQIALGIDPKSDEIRHSDEYYRPNKPGVTKISRNTMGGYAINEQSRTPEIKGVGYSSLGEIYLRTKRIPEAQAAFDAAVKANPSQAALYLRDETIFFFQIGNSEAQLTAAEKALAVDPARPMLYYFRGQALASKATVDPKTQKLTLPPGCAESYRKYLEMEPNGQFAADAKSFLIAAGVPIPTKTARN